MSGRLQDKSALVTGGGRGIGRGVVEAFVDEGARVLTCGRGRRPEDLPAAVLWQTADVSQAESVSGLEQRVIEEFGALSVLVNNAGVQVEKTVVESSDDDWEQVMGVNARGVFLMSRAMIPCMEEGGSIINISSISASVADPNMALYNASKAFVSGLTRSIAVDHGPVIRCNAICPGWIATDMAAAGFATASDSQAAYADALARHPVRRLGEPKDIAAIAVWLASEDAAFATGQCFTVDGGLTAMSPIHPALS